MFTCYFTDFSLLLAIILTRHLMKELICDFQCMTFRNSIMDLDCIVVNTIFLDRFNVQSVSDVIRCAGLQQFVQFEGIITGFSQRHKYTQVFCLFPLFAV